MCLMKINERQLELYTISFRKSSNTIQNKIGYMLGAENYDFNNETDYCINIYLKFV